MAPDRVHEVASTQHEPGQDGDAFATRRRSPALLIGLLIVGVLTVLFILRNRERVKVDFIFFDSQARTWVVILLAMLLGGLLTELIRLGVKRRRAKRA